MASLDSCGAVTGYVARLGPSPRSETGRILDWVDRLGRWCVGLLGEARPRRLSETHASSSSARASILVVEDEASLRLLIRGALEANGYTTLLAHHGGEAMQVAREHEGRIDLLITGAVLKAAGANIAADAICKERPGIKVLFVSRDVAAMTAPCGLDQGPVFLGGPFAPYALLHRVRATLRAR